MTHAARGSRFTGARAAGVRFRCAFDTVDGAVGLEGGVSGWIGSAEIERILANGAAVLTITS